MSFSNGGLAMLSQMLPKLSPSERKIASYLLQNPSESVSLTANELGQISLTSSATVIRLCKSLDLKGFQELKLRIAGDVQKSNNLATRDIEPNESTFTIIEKMTNNSMQILKETAELINPNELTKAVDALLEAKNIHFFGVGASSIIAQDAQQKFLRINKNATSFSDTHMAATLVANAQLTDVVVGISFSGETLEVSKIIELAKKQGVKTISLTKYGALLVNSLADIRLYTSAASEPAFRSGATASRIAQLHVIDILFMCVASQRYDETINYLDRTREAINFFIECKKSTKW